MSSLTFQGEYVKATMPKQLYKAIMKIQVSEDLDFDDACLRVAELLDKNGQSFKKAVQQEARRLHNSALMTELNKARESIRRKAWEEGVEYVRRNEDNFRVPCPRCGKPMRFSSSDEEWEKKQKILNQAFSNWSHAGE